MAWRGRFDDPMIKKVNFIKGNQVVADGKDYLAEFEEKVKKDNEAHERFLRELDPNFPGHPRVKLHGAPPSLAPPRALAPSHSLHVIYYIYLNVSYLIMRVLGLEGARSEDGWPPLDSAQIRPVLPPHVTFSPSISLQHLIFHSFYPFRGFSFPKLSGEALSVLLPLKPAPPFN